LNAMAGELVMHAMAEFPWRSSLTNFPTHRNWKRRMPYKWMGREFTRSIFEGPPAWWFIVTRSNQPWWCHHSWRCRLFLVELLWCCKMYFKMLHVCIIFVW
jgi:hypothetical protein